MDLQNKSILKTLNPWKIFVPILIGLAATGWLFYSNYEPDTFSKFFTGSVIWLVVALLVLFIRDAGYVYRIKHITEGSLTLKNSIYVIILWEFASAITPSAVGGSAIAIFILMKEKINLGRSIAYVMVTAMLDNLFFIIAAPIVIFLTKGNVFPNISGVDVYFPKGLEYSFLLSYCLITIYTLLMSYGLFLKPRAFKWILIKITGVRLLKKWRQSANDNGNEVILASEQLKGKPFDYWLKASGATAIVWVARYALVNCLVMAYSSIDFQQNMLVFSRQIILWIVMLISPTPGGSGIAETVFPLFFSDILEGYTNIIALFWRVMTYYPYLFLGAIFLPRWIRKVFFQDNLEALRKSREEKKEITEL